MPGPHLPTPTPFAGGFGVHGLPAGSGGASPFNLTFDISCAEISSTFRTFVFAANHNNLLDIVLYMGVGFWLLDFIIYEATGNHLLGLWRGGGQELDINETYDTGITDRENYYGRQAHESFVEQFGDEIRAEQEFWDTWMSDYDET